MANTTVYPFGTGGSLPSNIGIINDLTTGGVSSALSAQQGVVLKGLIDEKETEILREFNISPVLNINNSITVNNVWSAYNVNTHENYQAAVSPGERYRIVAKDSSLCYYAFLTERVYGSQTSGGAPPFVSGTSRNTIAAGNSEDITIPEGCNILFISKTNASADIEPASIYRIWPIEDYVDDIRYGYNRFVYGGCFANSYFSGNVGIAQATVTKTGTDGLVINVIVSASSRYILIGLPDGLIQGEKYNLTFNYEASLSNSWYLSVVGTVPNTILAGLGYIPATGSGTLSFSFVYKTTYAYFRLATNSVNSGSIITISGISIIPETLNSIEDRITAIEPVSLDSMPVVQSYSGRKIDLTEHKYGYTSHMSGLTAHQSSACYGDYAILVAKYEKTFTLVNLATTTIILSVTQDTYGSNDIYHANQSFFGTEFYDASDPFPLLYVSFRNDGSVTGGGMHVYRVIPTDSENTGEYTDMTVTLVQTVYFPAMTDDNCLGNPNFVLDEISGFLYSYSRNNNSSAENYNICRITRWNMPLLSAGDVTLTDSDILDGWYLGVPAVNMQGAAIKNGLLFIFRGYVSVGYIYLYVVDIEGKSIVATIDLLSSGFTMEPEGAFFRGSYLMTTNTSIYRFLFS